MHNLLNFECGSTKTPTHQTEKRLYLPMKDNAAALDQEGNANAIQKYRTVMC